jgi:hypothetical protein
MRTHTRDHDFRAGADGLVDSRSVLWGRIRVVIMSRCAIDGERKVSNDNLKVIYGLEFFHTWRLDGDTRTESHLSVIHNYYMKIRRGRERTIIADHHTTTVLNGILAVAKPDPAMPAFHLRRGRNWVEVCNRSDLARGECDMDLGDGGQVAVSIRSVLAPAGQECVDDVPRTLWRESDVTSFP